jgi:poly(hydroxyalkanoate) depolymerase family esterase
VYVPRGYVRRRRRPLLVLLHGCKQTAEDLAAGTRIARLADDKGWLVLLPQQTKQANPWGCWNWFDRRTTEGKGEAAIVAAQVRAVRRLYRAHPQRIVLLGMSAGACLAAVLALRFTKLFAAAGLHSGVACGAASNAAEALQAMADGPRADVGAIASAARAGTAKRALPLPVCILQGGADRLVAERNAAELLRQFLLFNGRVPADAGALPGADAATSVALANGRTMATDDYVVDDRLVARRVGVTELGHAWSGGDGAFAYNDPEPPDATGLFGEFFAAVLRQREAAISRWLGKRWERAGETR